MIEYIENTEKSNHSLDAVICVYGQKTVFHSFKDGILGAGEPLTTESINAIFKFVNSETEIRNYSFKGIIPRNVIHFSQDEISIMWFTKPGIKNLLFKDKNSLLESGEYALPALLWYLKGHSLYIYSIKKEPKSFKDKIFMAPFMNVSSIGKVCMGSAKFQSSSTYYEDIIQRVESAFYESYFTHTQTNHLLDGNFVEIMEKIFAEKKFYTKYLVPGTYKTIEEVIKNE